MPSDRNGHPRLRTSFSEPEALHAALLGNVRLRGGALEGRAVGPRSELLGEEAQPIVGLSEETTCFVSPEYFEPEADPFADFVLQETAHISYNCKRSMVGLPARGRREWLLELYFRKRETLAYACEAYGRILELGARPADRRRLLAEHLSGPMPGDGRVDEEEYRSVVTEAVGARDGWKGILRRERAGFLTRRKYLEANDLLQGRVGTSRLVPKSNSLTPMDLGGSAYGI